MTVSNTPGAPCWIEIFTSEQDRSVSFYTELFGWTADEPDEQYGGYLLFHRDGRPIAGCMRNTGDMGGADNWSVYLETPDIEATARNVTQSGGQVVTGPMQVGTLGHMLFAVDPAGALVGAWQPLDFDGFSARAQDGAPTWFETLSNDYEKSVAFYRDAFDWDSRTMSDTAGFRYTTLGEGDGAVAGIMDARAFLEGAPSVWQFYVQVADADATVEKAVQLGGTVVTPIDDTPYGRVAMLEDSTGIRFAVMGQPTS